MTTPTALPASAAARAHADNYAFIAAPLSLTLMLLAGIVLVSNNMAHLHVAGAWAYWALAVVVSVLAGHFLTGNWEAESRTQ